MSNVKKTGVAYLLWCTCFFGLAGVHRFYAGKYFSGIVWLFTLGFLGIGQLVDLALIPEMVEEENLKYRLLHGSSNNFAITPQVVVKVADEMPRSFQESNVKIETSNIQTVLQLARENKGKISLVDCVMATGKSAAELRTAIEYLCLEGVFEVETCPNTGLLIYKIV